MLQKLAKGQLRQLELKGGDTAEPPNGKAWLILSGHGYHVTGTITNLFVGPKIISSVNEYTLRNWLAFIPATTANGPFELFSTGYDETTATFYNLLTNNWLPIFVISGYDKLYFTAAATAVLNIKILEFDL